ncbi:MAG: addiction module toxin RelE [Duncaniella sp.]|nr:addiction module toxin RelE [Duncaniella sp.]
MSFKVITTPRFEKSAKALAKRYRSLKTDLGRLFASLETDPAQGDELSPGLRKLRMAITSKGRGKSGGARVITYTILTAESNGRVYLIDIYDKSDYSTVDVVILHQIISTLDMTSDS